MKDKHWLSALLLAAIATLAGAAVPKAKQALPPLLPDSGKVIFAGVRSSAYGIKPFPKPGEWKTAIETMAGYYPGSTPCAVWIVGTFKGPRTCRLFFPGDGQAYPHIEFEAVDSHEEFLNLFDKAGIKVWLQVEPANADMETLIDLVLNRYGRHECVVGFGVDVEWYREADNPKWGAKVDDALAQKWEAKVKSHNPKYTIFLKHWDNRWMPPAYRGEILFVDDSQIFKNFDNAVTEFVTSWANHFYPSTVVFQIGYNSDRPWWQKLPVPPQTWGEAICRRIKQNCGIIWVDFSLRDVLPLTSPLITMNARPDRGRFRGESPKGGD
jgi:hypothetical protein